MAQGLEDWLTLWRLLEQSPSAVLKLRAALGEPPAILAAGFDAWREAGLGPRWRKVWDAWHSGDDAAVRGDVERASRAIEALAIRVLTLDDPAYPPLLREIADPPPLLFCRGDSTLLSWPQIAVVGSRRPSQNGIATARDFSARLAAQGLGITSGLAFGIDAAAHEAALAANGMTVAVLGTGLADLYPRQHARLANNILARDGLLVSEFLPHTPPLQYHFPRRNRVISGLSLGVLVVEAGLPSGSLITARQALEQNREVWAIPGSIHNPQAKGCHALIREGARLVDEPGHVLEDIGGRLRFAPAPEREAANAAPADPMDARAAALLGALGWQVQSFDALVERTGYDASTIAGLLTELELAGRIAVVAGGYEQLVTATV